MEFITFSLSMSYNYLEQKPLILLMLTSRGLHQKFIASKVGTNSTLEKGQGHAIIACVMPSFSL